MHTRHRHRRTTTILLAVLALLATTAAAPVSADPGHHLSDLQRQVDAYLAAHPGGLQIGTTEISYAGGTFVVTLAPPAGTLAGPDCPTGWFCFYDGVNYTYPRGKLSSCGWQDLAWWGWQNRTESVHYAMSSGTVWFISHGGSNHSGDLALFDIDTSRRARPDVSPHRNIADHVYRFC